MSLLDLLFPKYCLGCRRPADEEGGYFCKSCLSNVKVMNRFDPISKTFSIFAYEGVIRKGIIKLKYNFAYDIASELSDLCVLHLVSSAYCLDTNVCLVPIPLHRNRENWRGFNQSELLGKLISQKLGWGFEKDLLIRHTEGKNQVGLAKGQRERNIRGKYAVNKNSVGAIHESPKNRIITFVIFDDVATTGSTIKEAIRVLEKCSRGDSRIAKRIFGLTIAR